MINGSFHGPRTVEIGNWSGKAIYSPRANIEEIFNRSELSKPAVYFLKSEPRHDEYTERIYIGQTANLKARLGSHLKNNKDDSTEFIAFVSKDDLLSPSQTLYLESRLISSAKEIDAAEITNDKLPKLPPLS